MGFAHRCRDPRPGQALIGAGYDTTASVLSWMLWCAALSPGVWLRLRAEADEVLGPPAAAVTEPDPGTLAKLSRGSCGARVTTASPSWARRRSHGSH
ncbi:MAG: cytochrome P450 [Acidimicrobiaceae bacterium]|nr:cytochrome P450 [Acidimicrobiaceae bacterium]